MKYDYKAVEAKWQKVWEDEKTFHVEIDHKKPKFYALVEFPYPSGAGLHVGHPRRISKDLFRPLSVLFSQLNGSKRCSAHSRKRTECRDHRQDWKCNPDTGQCCISVSRNMTYIHSVYYIIKHIDKLCRHRRKCQRKHQFSQRCTSESFISVIHFYLCLSFVYLLFHFPVMVVFHTRLFQAYMKIASSGKCFIKADTAHHHNTSHYKSPPVE